MKKISILVLFVITLLVSNLAFAAQYELLETYGQGKNYIDLDSIKKDVNNPNLIYYTVKLEFSPQNRYSNTEDYALETCFIDLQKLEVKYLEYSSYNSAGKLLSKMPVPVPAVRFKADDSYYQKIIQIANGNSSNQDKSNTNSIEMKSGSFDGTVPNADSRAENLEASFKGKNYKLGNAVSKIVFSDLYGTYSDLTGVKLMLTNGKALHISMNTNHLEFYLLDGFDDVSYDGNKVFTYEYTEIGMILEPTYRGSITLESLNGGIIKVTVAHPNRQTSSFNINAENFTGAFKAVGAKGNVRWQ